MIVISTTNTSNVERKPMERNKAWSAMSNIINMLHYLYEYLLRILEE